MADIELDLDLMDRLGWDKTGPGQLRDAIDLASDQNGTTWLTAGGKRVAKIAPVDEVTAPETVHLPTPGRRFAGSLCRPDDRRAVWTAERDRVTCGACLAFPVGTDIELNTMAEVSAALRRLDPATQERALNWLLACHGHGSAWEALSGAYRDLGLLVAELEGRERVVYRERAHLVAFLAALYPSVMGQDPDEHGRFPVYIELGNGQVSWHIDPKDRDLFAHVAKSGLTEWDGADKTEVYRRVRAETAAQTKVRTCEPCGDGS
jgi:hypothetical protein